MRNWEFRNRQREKRKKWATKIASRWVEPKSPIGRREVGKITNTHTFCGCFYCRRPKLLDIPSQMVRKQTDRMNSEARELG